VTNWTNPFSFGNVDETNSATTPVTVPMFGVQPGDLLVALCLATNFTATFPTGLGLTDTGSGGWANVGSVFNSGGAAAVNLYTGSHIKWKVATSADASASVTLTPTPTVSGVGTVWYAALVICDYRLTSGSNIVGDIFARTGADANPGPTTLSASPASGSTHSTFADELAITGRVGRNTGHSIGANTFTATSPTSALTTAFEQGSTGSGTVAAQQWVGGVQASATPGANVFVNSWSLPGNDAALHGVTFAFTPTGQILIV
jgi:hypothetical protein